MSSGSLCRKSIRKTPRRRRALLASAAGAVTLFYGVNSANAQDQPTDTYSFIYNSIYAQPLDGNLAAATNWYDLTVNAVATEVPSAPSTVQFDTTYADLNPGGKGDPPSGNLNVTLSSVAATTWAEVNFLSPAVSNQWVNAGGTTQAYVLTFTGANNAALTIGSGGITNKGTAGIQPTDVAISVPVNLGAQQTWTANASSITAASVVTATTVLAVSGNLSLGGFGASALTIAGTGNVSISGAISDGGAASGVVMNGSGTLNLAATNNAFSGGDYLNSGAVQVSSTQSLGGAGNLIQFNGGTLNFAGSALNNLDAFSVNGATAGTASVWSGVPLNLDISNPAGIFTLDNSMTGTGFLNQSGSGAIWITQATNSFSAGTTISSGSNLVVQDLAALGSGAVNNSGAIFVTGNGSASGNQAGTAALFAGAPFGSSPSNPFGDLTLTNATGPVANRIIGVTNGGNLVLDESQRSAGSPLVSSGASLIASGGNITFTPNGSAATVQVFSTTSFSNANTITATGAVGQETIFLGDYSYDNTNNVGTFSVTQTASASVVFNGPVTASGGDAFSGGTVATSDFAVVGNVYSAPAILNNSVPPGKGAVGYATYGLSDWAVVTTPNAGGTSFIVPGSAISGFYIHMSIFPNVGGAEPIFDAPRACLAISNDNIDVDCDGAVENFNNSAPTSIRFNSPTGGLSIIGGQTALQWLCGNSDGHLLECSDILVTPNVGAENVICSDDVQATAGLSSAGTFDIDPNGRSGSSVNAEIWNIDYQGNTAGLLIFNTGICNGSFSGGISLNGPGMLVLTTTSSYTGATSINGGTIEIQNNASLGGNSTNQNSINFFGGTFVAMQTTTLDATTYGGSAGTARGIVVSAGGADLAAIASVIGGLTLAQILTVDGAITGNGNLNIGMGNVTAVVNNASNSTLSFVNTSGNGKVILSGDATAFTGNIAVNFGSLQADGTFSPSTNFTAAAATTLSGSSPSTLASVTANTGSTLYPGDNGTGAMTVAQYTANNNSTLAFAFNPTTYACTDPLNITVPVGGNLVNPAGTVWLSLLQTGTTQVFDDSGEFDLINVFGSTDAFNPINGTFGFPGANVGGFEISTPHVGATVSLQTLAVGNNETELQLTINNPNAPEPSGWINPLGGAFNIPANWSGGVVPNGPGDIAPFPSLTATTISVTVPVPWTLGEFRFNTTNSYTISGAGPVLFNNFGFDGSIDDLLGQNQTIASPLNIAAIPSLDITVTNATDTLTLSGGITDSGAGSGLTLNATNNGGAGNAILVGTQNFSGAITIGNQLGNGSGTLQLGNGSAAGVLANSLTAINLDAGFLAFDEPSGASVTLANTITVPGAGGGTLVQEGAGSLLVLASSVAYNAPYPNVTLSAGTLRFAGPGSDTVGNFNQTGGLVDLGGQSVSFADLNGAGTIDNLSTTAANLTVNNSTNGTYSGIIQNSQAGTVSFTKNGPGILVFAGTNTYSGPTNLNLSTLVAASPGGLSPNSAIVNNYGQLIIAAGNSSSPVVSGNISGPGTLIIGTAGTAGYLQLASNSHISSVNWSALQLAGNSTLDIANNTLAINYAGSADPVATVVSLLTAGYGPAGNWKGASGILSSTAGNGGLMPLLSVGYADGNTDSGTPAGPNQILVMYTLAGDANLDGTVNFADLLIVSQNFNKTGEDWAGGNFTYDPTGLVNFTDLLLVAQNFNQTLDPPGGSSLGIGGNISSLAVKVPEPAGAALMLAASAGFLAARRRRHY